MSHAATPFDRFERAEARHVQAVRQACAERGITIRPRGACVRLTGAHVDILVVSLADVALADLAPPKLRLDAEQLGAAT